MADMPERIKEALADRYLIGREVGRGGMATVYLADDIRHDRRVAIKVLRPELTTVLSSDRFLREIRVTAKLSHPHILPLLDSGEVGGCFYYIMPYVEGESLRARMDREKQLPLEDALRITIEVGGALAYAHSRDFVHRDIKPENILFEAGHAVVTDFGLALALHAIGPERFTHSGISVGTPTYMSPEQASADEEIDARSDQYSLACVVYEMLAGQAPFVGPNPRVTMARHVTDPVPPLSTARPELAGGVALVVERALAKTPSARFATVPEFLEALATSEQRGASSPTNSIAVLAFENMSAEPENEYLSDGLSEEVINALTQIAGFQVASRTSSFAFKGSNEDIRAIGQRLGVRSVLEGSVRKANDRLRVTAQLINVEDGYHLWSDRYDSDMEDVFAIQDQIAQNIAAALQVVLSEDDKRALQTARTADIQAYDYYLRGRQFFRQFRKKSLQFAKEMFTRAIEVDPNYALAHAGVADSCSYLHMYWRTGEADLQLAHQSSQRALELDPDLAEAHASRGLIANLLKNFEEAEQEFQTAIALKPNLWQAHYYYGRACFQQGKLEQAVSLFERATQGCEDWEARFFAAQCYAAMHQEEQTDAAYRLALRVTEEHLELNPDDARAATMAAVSACRVGQRDRGLEWARKAISIDPSDAGVSYNVACVYALEGIKDEAFTCLEAARRGGFWHPDWIQNDPDLDSLRDDPRFEALLAEDS